MNDNFDRAIARIARRNAIRFFAVRFALWSIVAACLWVLWK